VQVRRGLGGEAGLHAGVYAGGEVGGDDVVDEVGFGHGGPPSS